VPEIIRRRATPALGCAEIDYLGAKLFTWRTPDYQMAAWLMAVFFSGLSPVETHLLTQAMLHSGDVVTFKEGFISISTAPVVSVINELDRSSDCCCCRTLCAMIAGRGLAHTGGTLDKLESIPGFNTRL